ncbi:hypothetical protein, partial [Metapseudomonas resinovorans]|uniref:hypothetical protein n=1 Tax=Metapseudomonas resinovorans TaxID=53412 RepID=UPI001FDF59BD
HTNCLIQLLKSVSIKSFVSTEAAHPTAAFLTVKLFFENLFSTQPLAPSIRSLFSSAGGAFYSAQSRCQHLLSNFVRQWRTLRSGTSQHLHQPLNSLIYKEFFLATAPEEVRIIGMQILPSILN